jgi:dipeptidyl aminopeptidase/acylaminoacyl peptidase
MSKRIKTGLKILIGVVIVILAVAAVYFVFPQLWKSPVSVAASSVFQKVFSTSSTSDNGLIVFVSEVSGNPEIYTMQSDGTKVTELTKGLGKSYSPRWSPDGKHIAYIGENNGQANVFVMNADGSSQTRLSNASNTNQISYEWSLDSKRIEYSEISAGDPNATSISTVNVNGNESNILAPAQNGIQFLGWSFDRKQIIYEQTDSKSGKNNINIINVDGSGKKELAQIAGLSQLLHWQDANHFYVISNTVDLWEIDLIGTDGDQPEKIASYTDSGIVTWFGSKNSLTYVTNHFESWTWNRIDGKNTTFLATWPNYAAQCKKSTGNMILGEASNNSSPDGLHGLVGVWCDDGSTSFYFVNNDGSKIIQLFGANIPSQFIDANWSPDGQNIVITLGNNQTGNSDFYLINVNKILQDPSIQPIQLTNDKAWKYDASWQPQP